MRVGRVVIIDLADGLKALAQAVSVNPTGGAAVKTTADSEAQQVETFHKFRGATVAQLKAEYGATVEGTTLVLPTGLKLPLSPMVAIPRYIPLSDVVDGVATIKVDVTEAIDNVYIDSETIASAIGVPLGEESFENPNKPTFSDSDDNELEASAGSGSQGDED